MIHPYFPVFVIFVLAALFVIGGLISSIVLGPRKHNEVKDDPFECGTVGTGSANERFSVKFYLAAVVFILFDIEIAFLFPWATQALKLGWHGFSAVMLFLAILAVGLAYIWRRGVLDWS